MCIFSRRWFGEFNTLRLETELLSVVNRGRSCILLRHWISFFSVFSEKDEEFLISSDLYHLQLEVVPCLREKRLYVALEHCVFFLVFSYTLSTDEGAECDIAVSALVALAIHTESVELVFLHLFPQEISRVWSLWVCSNLNRFYHFCLIFYELILTYQIHLIL